jgi:ATP-dependent RNA helicase DHR2
LQSLLAKPISKSSAIQRKGRAGRESAGKCYRLYTEEQYLSLPENDLPEILRSDVVEAVLTMKARGVNDVLSFPLMDSPDVEAMERALLLLHSLGALDDDGQLNHTGKLMAQFPLQAAYARVLVAAAEPSMDCLLEAIDVVAVVTSGEHIFIQPKFDELREDIENMRRELIRREGDVLTYLTTMQKYVCEHGNRMEWCKKRNINHTNMAQAARIRKQLRVLCQKNNVLPAELPDDNQEFTPVEPEKAETLLKCFLKAFSLKTASLHADGSYRTTQGKHPVAIHPSSVLHGQKKEAIMFLEHVFTQKNYAKKVSAVQMNWIAEAMGA